ncbi:fluoride efflux transporter FluC [Cellulomonas gilvus]|uniref:Fluoride-specific ion channel FluC n=1 Tax=Cellulomonas gilvus (strain ATCC 13127 / NRRL B-14078) TaxID=593907 RepID=F8A718_CELGA|nr:CrcB family protein [Cellulomonas gilvus]AEI13505.1 Camphor resistance CrcB protein [Cellulomonas gilvus ATCC 13127]
MTDAARAWAARRAHVRLVGLVFAGGALGTALRWVIEETWARPTGWPWATFVINVVGSFVLGALLERLARGGPDVGRRRAVRLACGTGVLGGFTTYSTFVLEVERLASDGELARAFAYPVASVVLGVLAAGAGMTLARRARGVVA